MKKNKLNFLKRALAITAAVFLSISLSVGVCAEETDSAVTDEISGKYAEIYPDNTQETEADSDIPEENTEQGGEFTQNVFEEIYKTLELNADKIFSILAFVGTLVVGVGYKSGLLPLLRDALSKLKGAIDGVKADGEISKAMTESKMAEMSEKIAEINQSLEKNNGELRRIEWQFDNCEQLMAERESMRIILEGQIDMLYAIFMSSALPQYQKDEIGTKISEMREELTSYEESVKK